MLSDYGKWLSKQTSDRQEASLTHIAVCARLGELQRSAPRSKEVEELSQQVKDYYTKLPSDRPADPAQSIAKNVASAKAREIASALAKL